MKSNIKMLKRLFEIASLFFLNSILIQQVSAAIIPIENPGFEEYVLSDALFTIPEGGRNLAPFGIFESNPIPGWKVTIVPGRGSFEIEAGTFNPNTARYPGEAPEGQNIAYSNGPTISQSLNAVLTANTPYTLEVDIGRRLDEPSPGYIVSLLADGVVLANDVNTLIPDVGGFITSTILFEATSSNEQLGKLLEIQLEPFSFDNGGTQVNFDNVRLQVVPVPAAVWLLGTSLIGLIGMSKFKSLKPA